MSTTKEIKIGGFGGQGVILSGMIIGKAASIYDKKYAVMTQSFGPEARGSSSSSEVIVSNSPIPYPYVTSPEILVVLSKDAAHKFIPQLKPEGILIYETDLVKLEEFPKELIGKYRTFDIPATRFAEELRRTMVMNIVMLGFFTFVTELITPNAMREAIKDSVPRETEALNMNAFDKGYNYAQQSKK